MGAWMERLPAQSVAWRLFAAFIVLLLLILSPLRPAMPGAGLNWAGIRTIYWSFAILGLLGYAYGFRILPRSFWRVYALLFTTEITIRFVTMAGWVPVARLLGIPAASRHGTLTILFALWLIATTCVALLRYGGWLNRSDDRSSPSDLESIFS